MKKIIIICLFVLASVFSFGRDFVIAGIPEEPSRWLNEEGKFQGLDVDIIDYIMAEMGIEYRIILEKSSTRLRGNWKRENSPYDMIFTYSLNDDRKKFLNYANESHVNFSWNFFIRKEDEGKFVFKNYEDLRGVKIGATKGFSYSPEFWKASDDKIIKLDTVVKNELQLSKLFKKRFDMVPLNTQTTLYRAKKNGFSEKISFLSKPIKSKPYYNTFVKSSNYPNIDKIIKDYDVILKEMKEDGTLSKILSKYGIE